MDRKKIVFIVVTVLSVVASLIACTLGLPYVPVVVDYDAVGESPSEATDGQAAEFAAEAGTEGEGVSADPRAV